MTYHPNTNRRHRRILNLIARKLTLRYRHGLPPQIQGNNNTRNPYDSSVTHLQKTTPFPISNDGTMEERATTLAYLMSLSK